MQDWTVFRENVDKVLEIVKQTYQQQVPLRK